MIAFCRLWRFKLCLDLFLNPLVCEADLVPNDALPEVRGLEVDVEGGALAEHLVL